jgi:hypothetical protein
MNLIKVGCVTSFEKLFAILLCLIIEIGGTRVIGVTGVICQQRSQSGVIILYNVVRALLITCGKVHLDIEYFSYWEHVNHLKD